MGIVPLDRSNSSIRNLRKHQQLLGLLGAAEVASWEMLRAAEAAAKAKKGTHQGHQPETRTAHACASRDDTKLPAFASKPDMAKTLENDLEADSEGSEPKSSRKRKTRDCVASKGEKQLDATEKGHKRSFVEHNYVDHSQDLPTGEELNGAPKSRGGITTPFPVLLHDMLQSAETRGYSNAVSWQAHGRAFLVHDSARFVSDVMPMFFRQSRMPSFQRQLSLYGFLRLTRKGADHGAYYHELFLRDMPHLCHRMMRTRVKGYWVRQSSSPDSEPDFSKMPPVVGLSGLNEGNLAEADGPARGPQHNAAAPVAALDSTLWQLISESNYVPGLELKPPACTTTLASRGQVEMPPMPPLGPAMAGLMENNLMVRQLDQLTSQTLAENSWPPPRDMLNQRKRPFDTTFSLHGPQLGPHGQEQDVNEDECDELHRDAMNMSPKERDDMAAFLSDVDLTSGDEDSVEEGFEEEAKIGRVASCSSLKKKRRVSLMGASGRGRHSSNGDSS